MDHLTYTALGHFYPATKKLIADLRIPAEVSYNRYVFSKFDMSTEIDGNLVNVIFCHMKLEDGRDTRLSSANYNHILQIADVENLTSYPVPNNPRFDTRKDYSLLLIFHDNSFSDADRDVVYHNLSSYHRDVVKNGNFNIYLNGDKQPRILGVSIIRR